MTVKKKNSDRAVGTDNLNRCFRQRLTDTLGSSMHTVSDSVATSIEQHIQFEQQSAQHTTTAAADLFVCSLLPLRATALLNAYTLL